MQLENDNIVILVIIAIILITLNLVKWFYELMAYSAIIDIKDIIKQKNNENKHEDSLGK